MKLLQSGAAETSAMATASVVAAEVQSLCVATFPVDSFAIHSNLMAADNPVRFSLLCKLCLMYLLSAFVSRSNCRITRLGSTETIRTEVKIPICTHTNE